MYYSKQLGNWLIFLGDFFLFLMLFLTISKKLDLTSSFLISLFLTIGFSFIFGILINSTELLLGCLVVVFLILIVIWILTDKGRGDYYGW